MRPSFQPIDIGRQKQWGRSVRKRQRDIHQAALKRKRENLFFFLLTNDALKQSVKVSTEAQQTLHSLQIYFSQYNGDLKKKLNHYLLMIPAFLPGELHAQRSLASYSPWDCKELDMAKRLSHTHIY